MSYRIQEGHFPASVIAETPLTISVNGATYTLGLDKSQLLATTSILGLIKAGEGLAIASDGTLSVAQNEMPIASGSQLGGVKVGSGLAIDVDGVLSSIAEAGGAFDSFATRAAIPSTTIPDIVTRIITVGHTTAGDGGSGAPYVRSTSSGPYAIQDAGGNWWALDLAGAKAICANWFGMVADAHDSWDGTTLTRTGTDNAPMLQAAIDCAIQHKVRVVTILDGIYATNETIQLGYGNNLSVFVDIELISASGGRGAYAELAGVHLYSKRTDRPVVNFQGVRMARIAGICMIGYNYYWLANTTLPRGDDNELPETWLNPSLVPSGDDPGGLSRYAPYSAITVDAYKWAQQANHYPTVTYPSWSGSSTQYNKSASSDITIDNCYIAGFAVGISTPAGDGNADFIKIRDNSINYCVDAIAICHTQSRNVDINSNNFERCHTIVNNNRYGQQAGRLGGPITNNTIGNSYQLFDFRSLGYIGPVSFNHVYMENVVRLGYISAVLAAPYGFVFNHCKYDGDPQGGSRTLPNALIDGSIRRASIEFNNCAIFGPRRIYNLVKESTATVSINGGTITGGAYWTGANGSTAMRNAVNYCCGMLIGGGAFGNPYNASAPKIVTNSMFIGTSIDEAFDEGTQLVSSFCDFIDTYGAVNRIGLNQFNTGINDLAGNRWSFRSGGPRVLIQFTNTGHVTDLTNTSGHTWTYNLHQNFQAIARTKHKVGTIVFHQPTGTIFVVTAIGSLDGSYYPITAVQQNNMKINSDGTFASQLLADSTLAGNSFAIDTSIVMSREVLYGDFTSGSATVANVSRGDGVGSDLSSWYSVGDILFIPEIYDASGGVYPYVDGVTIAAMTPGNPATITLSANATATGRFKIHAMPLV